MKAFSPLLVVLYFFLAYFVCRVLVVASEKQGVGKSSVWLPWLKLDRNVLFSCCGSLFFTFFISIIAQVVLLFQCYSHPSPNADRSVQSYPALLCGSPPWMALFAFAVIATILF